MKYTFDKGIAFILEGATEKVFYLSLLNHLCKKYELDELIAFAKEKLDGRELTPEEKMEYLIDQ